MRKIVLYLASSLLLCIVLIYFLHEEEPLFTSDPTLIGDDKPMVAITYDDGPHETVTMQILDVLEKYDAKATFFVLGARVLNHSTIIKRIDNLGCEIGNHTYGHKDLTALSEKEMLDQLNASNDALLQILNAESLPKIARPPFGNTNSRLEETIPYPIIKWSIDTKDWTSLSIDNIVNEVMKQVQDGDIILMHDMNDHTVKATEILVKQLIDDGYQLVTVSQMFAAKNISLENGKIYKNAR